MLSRDEVLENIQDGFIQYIPREYENDKEIVLAVVSKFGLELHNTSFQLRADKEVVLAAISQDGLALMYADNVLRSRYDVVLAAVEQNGLALMYVDDILRSQYDVVLAAVKQNGLALEYMLNGLTPNMYYDVALAAVSQNGFALKYVNPSIIDEHIVLKAVTSNSNSISLVPQSLITKELMLVAVAQDGLLLTYANEALLFDREISLAAVTQDGMALQYVPEFVDDEEFILAAVRSNPDSYELASERLRHNKEIATLAVKLNPLNLAFSNLRNDYDVVLEAVQKNGNTLQFASNALQNNIQICTAAIDQNKEAFKYVGIVPEDDYDFMIHVAKTCDGFYMHRVSDRLYSIRDFVYEVLPYKPDILGRISDELINDRDLILYALKNGATIGWGLWTKARSLYDDKEIMLLAVKNDSGCIKYISSRLKHDPDILLTALINTDMHKMRTINIIFEYMRPLFRYSLFIRQLCNTRVKIIQTTLHKLMKQYRHTLEFPISFNIINDIIVLIFK